MSTIKSVIVATVMLIGATGTTLADSSSSATPANEKNYISGGYLSTSGGRPIKSSNSAYTTPPATSDMGKNSAMSFFRKGLHNFPIYHESGSSLFPSDSGIAGLFDTFIGKLKTHGTFVHYFEKLQLAILYKLYDYLVNLYTNLNITFSKDIWDHLRMEEEYNLNTKTLIVNHLLALVSGQIDSFIAGSSKSLHKATRLFSGKRLLKHDYNSSFHIFVLQSEKEFVDAYTQPITKGYQKSVAAGQTTPDHVASSIQKAASNLNDFRVQSLDVLKAYHNFMQGYTGTLVSKSGTTEKNVFKKLAADVHKAVSGTTKPQRPGVFYYSQEALRAVELIPRLCDDITPDSKKIGWQKNVIDAAKNDTLIESKDGNIPGSPIAYMTVQDPNNPTKRIVKTDTQDPTSKLLLNMIVSNAVHVQEVLKEPDWLSSKEGTISFLRGCLGDYQQIVGLGILDPCLEGVLLSATGDPRAAQKMTKCKAYLQAQAPKPSGPSGPSGPDYSSGF